MNITQTEIEALAVRLAEPTFPISSKSSVERVIGHLDEDDYHAVMVRSGKLSFEHAANVVNDAVTLTEAEIELLGSQLADNWSKDEPMSELTCYLHGANLDAVLTRADDISSSSPDAASLTALAEGVEGLLRLARAAGCPDNVAIFPWLRARGLVEEVDGEWKFKTAKLGIVT